MSTLKRTVIYFNIEIQISNMLQALLSFTGSAGGEPDRSPARRRAGVQGGFMAWCAGNHRFFPAIL